MIFFWFIIPFLVLMVLSGTRRHQREEENEDEKEGLKRMKRAMKVGKLH
jgi:hypothetical protein